MMSQVKKWSYVFILVPVFLLMFSACATIQKDFESPTVHIVDIKVKEIKLLEAAFNVELRVINPNDTPIISKGINFDLEINDKHLASGVSGLTTEIPAFGTALLPMELYSSALDVVRNIIALSDQKTLKYRIKGRLAFEGSSLMFPYIPFESEGELDTRGLMQ